MSDRRRDVFDIEDNERVKTTAHITAKNLKKVKTIMKKYGLKNHDSIFNFAIEKHLDEFDSLMSK